MACSGGCNKKIPNSVALRMQAAAIAAQACQHDAEVTDDVFMSLVERIYNFSTSDYATTDLDGSAEDQDQQHAAAIARADRAALLWRPLITLGLRESVIEQLECDGLNIGAFVQQHELRNLTDGDRVAYEKVNAALAAHGLRIGMTQEQVKDWIFHGKQTATA